MKTLLMVLLALALLAVGCTTGDGEEEGGGEEGDAALPEASAPVEADESETDEAVATEGETLAAVQERGTLRCGVNESVPGFGLLTEEGTYEGFDIDFCRVIAAAVLGDAEAVEFVPLTAEQRFTALQSGEIDVLVRNTTWTASRDGGERAAFAAPTFYDGQGMMVRADSPFQTIEDMADTAICVLSGTTTELNLAQRFEGINYEPVPFEDNETLQQAFTEGRCDGWTSDRSQLAGVRSAFPEGPEALRILDETFSKEPLAPAVRDADPQWRDAVNWAVLSTIAAEELGVDSTNVESPPDDPNVRALLGQPAQEGDAVLDPGLGLAPDFVVDVISQVGNYAEIYNRHVGPGTPLDLERGLNALYTEGGLHYAPPYR